MKRIGGKRSANDATNAYILDSTRDFYEEREDSEEGRKRLSLSIAIDSKTRNSAYRYSCDISYAQTTKCVCGDAPLLVLPVTVDSNLSNLFVRTLTRGWKW